MSKRQVGVLCFGLGVILGTPVIGIGATLLADVVHNWHQRRIA